MKKSSTGAFVLSVNLLAPLAAQNFVEDLTFSASDLSPTALQDPRVDKAQGFPDEAASAIAAQDVFTLESRPQSSRSPGSTVNIAVLQKPSPFRSGTHNRPPDGTEVQAEDIKQGLDLISAAYREVGKAESHADCKGISLSIEHRIQLDVSTVLEIVETEIKANPACCCEIVKTAIKASAADTDKVVAIVETAITAAPETMRIVSQCAIAAAPESLAAVQALLASYDANTGESESAKGGKYSIDSKDAKVAISEIADPGSVAAMPNPLDFPGVGPVGPTPGGPGGQPLIPPAPPIVITPPVSIVDP